MNDTELFPVLKAGSREADGRLQKIKNRNLTFDEKLISKVSEIIRTVRVEGDPALKRFTKEFDGITLNQIRVPIEEIEKARAILSDDILSILREAVARVRKFHEMQKQTSWHVQEEDGTLLGQRIIPVDKVALYVPGGTATYPSTVIMNAVPAQVARVRDIILLTPPNKDGNVNQIVLATCSILGIENVFSIGGAQAIAAAAYGTGSVPKVDKIVGPGNIYVSAAKKLVYGDVDIDMIAGPSEVVVLADGSADPAEVAADLLAQSEHDANAAGILVTTDSGFARKVQRRILKYLQSLPRSQIASESMRRNGTAFVVGDLHSGVDLVNQIAPEHLEIIAEGDLELAGKIVNAGAIFVGRYSPEPVGDYFAGPSHVLPTGGTARFSSVLNVDSFVKRSSIIRYSRDAFERDSAKIRVLAEHEGLDAHALSIKVREKSGR